VFTRPGDLTDDEVRDALGSAWGLRVSHLDYAAVGFGSHHWRAVADGARWFVTVDDLAAKRHGVDEPLEGPLGRRAAALTTARLLHDAGMQFVVAPVPTTGGDVVHRLTQRYAIALHPFVEGRTHSWGPYESAAERTAVVALLARLHHAPPGCRAAAGVDDLTVPRLDELMSLLEAVDADDGGPWTGGPYSEHLRQLLGDRRGDVLHLVARHTTLAAAQRSAQERWVLTHGEPHRANTVTTASGTVLVDWDTVLVAPPERDLWRLVAEDAQVAGEYTALTGVRLDPGALELYGLTWDLGDIAIYASDLHAGHTDTEDVRTAWRSLEGYLS
jgi:Phosphotransferase enzyme family